MIGLAKATLPYAFALTILFAVGAIAPASVFAATETTATQTETDASSLLTDQQLELLVARIALYPDELIAVIVAASLEPLQLVQAQRYLESRKEKPDLKPNPKWDGSIISLLNYPDVVKMMNDDLDWVEQLGAAAANQQQDLLEAIQQLRDQAVASGVLKGNDKVVVEQANEKVIVRSADPEVVYVPTYDPAMLTDPGYVMPAGDPLYYSDPYPAYWYPGAGFWAEPSPGPSGVPSSTGTTTTSGVAISISTTSTSISTTSTSTTSVTTFGMGSSRTTSTGTTSRTGSSPTTATGSTTGRAILRGEPRRLAPRRSAMSGSQSNRA